MNEGKDDYVCYNINVNIYKKKTKQYNNKFNVGYIL